MTVLAAPEIAIPETFRPLPPFTGGWAQTIAAVYWPQLPAPRPTVRHVVPLEDGDSLAVLENRPAGWRPGDRIVVLVHGLVGSSASKDVVRLARKLLRHGHCVMRVNLRNCGPGFGLARRLYHSGRSGDTRAVLRWLAERFPESPVTQIGFSLGGNITLKMAGEDCGSPSGRLDSVVAVSAPVDLAACAARLERPENRFFDRYFVGLLVRAVARLERRFPDLPRARFPRGLTLRGFDDCYTAPRSGFRDAADYYAQSSSGQFLPRISCRALVLCAEDDPIVDVRGYRGIEPSEAVRMVITPHGGHVGFLAWPVRGRHGVRWMDELILNWLEKVAAAS